MKRPDTLANEIEKLLGRASSDALIGASGLDEDPLLTHWVQRIGAEVAAHSDRLDTKPEFLILGSDVANALTLPGSKILVTRGLLDEITSDDALAGVLAHEMGHVAKKHAWKQLESNGIFALLTNLLRPKGSALRQGLPVLNLLRALAQSRENEYEADRFGLGFAAAAGYAPHGLLHFIETMAGSALAPWEEYFSTHPAGPKRLVRGKNYPSVAASDEDSRASVAAGLDQRGFSGLAALSRQGRDPLVLPPLSPVAPEELALGERQELVTTLQRQRVQLLESYKPIALGGTLQQLLLLTAQGQDLRLVALSTHAYLLQFQIQDVYARTLRVVRTALGVWDGLVAQTPQSAAECLQGRVEIREALGYLSGVLAPLQRASTGSVTALTDLHLGRFYRLSSGAQWTRVAAIEGLIRYAESELSRADRAAGIAWRYLCMARLRRYQFQLDRLVSQEKRGSQQLFMTLLEQRLGRAVKWRGLAGSTGIEAALRIQQKALKPRPAVVPWADWALQSGGVPENIATVLRLLTLDLERELAARASLKWNI